jgi:hypothetical protein
MNANILQLYKQAIDMRSPWVNRWLLVSVILCPPLMMNRQHCLMERLVTRLKIWQHLCIRC